MVKQKAYENHKIADLLCFGKDTKLNVTSNSVVRYFLFEDGSKQN